MTSTRRKFFRFPWRSRKQIRADVEDELRFHLDMRVEALVASGAARDSAHEQAHREFGDLEDARRYIRAVDHDIEAAQRRSDFMNDLWHDVGYALRKLRAAPLFSLAVIVTLALGIGANTAIFSVVNGVLLEPLPFPQADHLVRIRFTQRGQGDASTPMDIVDLRTRAKSFSGLSVVDGMTANLVRDNADAERVQGARVGANFFTLLRTKPIAGRFFTQGEDDAGANAVVVISEQLWKRDFGGSASALGKLVRINAQPATIVGVVAGDQRYPLAAELWMPRKWAPNELVDASRGARWLGLIGRVKDGIPVEVADNETLKISEAMEKAFPDEFTARRAHALTIQDWLVGSIRKPLFIMLGAVALVLLIACANVANLMLVRATAREGEMAVRTALGAGRGRLIRQLLTESVLLSILGGLAGLAIAKVGMVEMLKRAPQNLPLVATTTIDATALAVTAIVVLLTGVIFGVLPAMQVGRSDLITTLRAGGRGARSLPGANRAKQVIVIVEVALAVTLLTGAGLLLHSFVKLLSVDPGFRPEGVISMKVALPQRTYDSTASRNFIVALEQRARALPGAKDVGVANFVPLDGASYNFSFTIRGRPPIRPSDQPSTEVRQVTQGFFSTMGMQLLRGRGLEASDRPGTTPVMVINSATAKKFFANEDPLGQMLQLGWGSDTGPRQIVGIVADVRSTSLSDEPEPTVYVPIMQAPYQNLTIVVRTNAVPSTLAPALRAIVHDLDHDVPVYSVQTMTERVASSVGQQRFYATLIAIFAAVALVLSAVGLYGVIAYAVSQRTHELGVRVALGATGNRIARMVVGEGLALTAIGVVIGVGASAAAGRLLSTLLFGVGTMDPVTLAGVVAMLGAVAALASWLPARRAARVDPLTAIRGD